MEDGINILDHLSNEQDMYLATEELLKTNEAIKLYFNSILVSSVEDMSAVGPFVDMELSTESEKTEFKKQLNDINTDIASFAVKKFKKLSPIADKSSSYKNKILKELYDSIESGKLVPVKHISKDKIKGLQDRLAVFSATGYSLKSGAGDLISFIEGLKDITRRNGNYTKQINNAFEELKAVNKEVSGTSGPNNLIKKLHLGKARSSRKENITDYRMSMVKNWFSNHVELFVLYKSNKYGYKVASESFDSPGDVIVGRANDKDTLRLIDTGLQIGSDLSDNRKALSAALVAIVKENTVALIKADTDPNIDTGKRFVMSKFTEHIMDLYINLYKNLLNVDDIIIAYINATYESNRKK